MIPGALSQMLIMAEENKKSEYYGRQFNKHQDYICCYSCTFISYFFQDSGSNRSEEDSVVNTLTEALTIPNILFISTCNIFSICHYGKIHFPTRQLLAPILVLICWNLLTGVTFTLDNYIIAAAQVIYMIRIGIQIANY